ncbi:unnamed protein product [Parnassius mnemosyne]|uniref:Mitogen-activated protein kinase kinase kinase N-terminal domain-containing protein n=1 Tax=Parnassius mnemosyne TaxID=213953 RepID=A0AAV1K8T4_9NEOP
MREISSLLDAFYAVIALYPSSSAAEADQPCLAQPRLKNRIRAMCLWYNTALHMRLKMVSLRRMLRSSRAAARSAASQRAGTPTDSTSSDASVHSDTARPADIRSADTSPANKNHSPIDGLPLEEKQEPTDVVDGKETAKDGSDKHNKCEEEHNNCQEREDVVDSGIDSRSECLGDCTPEIIVTEARNLNVREAGETGDVAEADGDDDPLRLGALHELAQLRLLGNTDVPLYRDYHYEMLKTQGVRRCMTFIQKICYNMLRKVYLTLLDPEEAETDPSNEDASMESLLNTKSDFNEKTENKPDQIDENSYELRRYGCRCRESVDMRLPSYRSHFVLLSSMCMEAVHDYLALRLEARPAHPSSLTVKQLIHELKEGLDIATEIRCAFVRYAAAALRGERGERGGRACLLQLLRTFDSTVATALQQYLSYLSTMSETESLPRAALAAEWAFTARLAARAPRVSARAPAAFVDIACKQLQRLVQRFDEKFASLMEVEVPNDKEESRYVVYALCRGAQQVYANEREAALQAAQAARALAARLHPRRARLRTLLCENLMCLCKCVVRHTEHILERSRLPDESRAEGRGERARELADSMAARVRELLLQAYKLGFEVRTHTHTHTHSRAHAH